MKSAILILLMLFGQAGDENDTTRRTKSFPSEAEWLAVLTKDSITQSPKEHPRDPELLQSYAFRIHQPENKGELHTFIFVSQRFKREAEGGLTPTSSRVLKGKVLRSGVFAGTGEYQLACAVYQILEGSGRGELKMAPSSEQGGSINFTFDNPTTPLKETKTLKFRFESDANVRFAWKGKDTQEFVREEFFRKADNDRAAIAKVSPKEWERIVATQNFSHWESDDIVYVSLGEKGKPRQLFIKVGTANRVGGQLKHDSKIFVGSWSEIEVDDRAIRVQCRIDDSYTSKEDEKGIRVRGFRGGELELVFKFVIKNGSVSKDQFHIYYWNSKPLQDLSWWTSGEEAPFLFIGS